MSIPPEEEKTSPEKPVLFSNISHEFRALLTSMLEPLEDLLAKPDLQLAPEDHGEINIIHHNALRLLKLANMLLDLSHVKADRNQAISEPNYLASFTEAAKRELETETKGIKQIELALSESEERFRSAFDHAAIGMALVSPEGQWLKVNRSLCKILGYSEEELMAMDFHVIAHPDDLITDLARMHQILNGEIDAYQIEKRYFHKLVHIVWTQLNVSLVRDYRNDPLYFISQIQDVTERKRAEKELPESQKILAEAQRIAHLGSWDWDIQSNELSWS